MSPLPEDDDRRARRRRHKRNPSLLAVVLICAGIIVAGVVPIVGAVAVWLAWQQRPAAVAANPDLQPAPDSARAPAEPPAKPPEPKAPIKPAPQAGPEHRPGTLPLQELKAATVYLKSVGPGWHVTGSGFVVRTQGDAVYIATNSHVVARPMSTGPPPRPPFDPRPPAFPPFPVPAGGPPIEAVFRSGTPQEQVVRAVIVADDDKADLAVLKATGVKEPPPPIDCSRAAQPVEAMPVLALGFPFGELLDPKRANPAITVTRGSVSSLRLNARGQLEAVQTDLDLNPGNSGGPVVDENGALIGVAVAKVRNTRIGFAVPVHTLNRLMEGHIDAPDMIYTLAGRGGETQVQVAARAADPLGRLRAPVLLYGPADKLKMPPLQKGAWQELAGAQASELKVEGTRAVAVLTLASRESGEAKVLAQVRFVNSSGQVVHSEPRVLRLNGELELTKLLADLKSPMTRRNATIELGWRLPLFRLQEVRSGLGALLEDRDPDVRYVAEWQLAACDRREAVPVLMKLLKDESVHVRMGALHLLTELKDLRATEAVAAVLGTGDAIHATTLLKALGPDAEKAVLPYLAQDELSKRFWTIMTLQEIGTATSLPALDKLAAENDFPAKQAARMIRERLVAEGDWPQLLEDLKIDDPSRFPRAVRRIAATPPVEKHREAVVRRLESLSDGQWISAQDASIEALARWGGKGSVPTLVRWAEQRPWIKEKLIHVLAGLPTDEAAVAVAKWMPGDYIHRRAANALVAMGPIAEKAVIPQLTREYPPPPPDPMYARGGGPPRQAHKDVQLAGDACWVLAQIGGRDSVVPLTKAARDDNPFLARAATVALEAIEARAGGSLLVPGTAQWQKSVDQAHALAARGEWRAAVVEYAKLPLELPEDLELGCERASVLLLAEDREAYVRLCKDVLRHFYPTEDPHTLYLVARIASLAAGAPADPERVVPMAERAVAAGGTAWFRHSLAVAHYRAGQYDKAVQQCQESMKADPRWANVLNGFVLALARHRLGHADEARQWLDKSTGWMTRASKARPKETPVDLPVPSWCDRLELQLLRREADALLGTEKK
jgi:S1-C subfamily serine protease/HEAT repeat protein